MIVTIHQPEHLPWAGFFDKMRRADLFVLLDTTQFAKDDFQNRNRIKTQHGVAWLTVPVYKKGRSNQLIKDVAICNERNWQSQCWSRISQSYRHTPFFAQHQSFFAEIYTRPWATLVDLNVTIVQYLATQLGLHTQIVTASELGVYEQGGTNVNSTICRLLTADVYLSGAHGRTYLDESRFAADGIEVWYQDFQHPVYPQMWGDFVSNLSVIDLLFHCGNASLDLIAQANTSTSQPAATASPLV